MGQRVTKTGAASGRLAAALAVVVTAVGLTTGCQATIASELDEAQANAVVVALDGSGIGATKERSPGSDAWDVLVPNDDVGPALSVLRSANLPREEAPGLAEIFGEPALIPTATEERARWVAAQSGELARSVEAMDGVLDARVHLALPMGRDRAFDEERPPPRASVLVRKTPTSAMREEAVRALIAGAIPDLAAESIAVVSVEVAPATTRQASLVHIGPIAVTQGSAPILKAVFGGAFTLSALLALALLFTWVRLRRPRIETESADAEPA
ncbi:MAG: secretion protein [Deltaproteobacteria bacterium]|nr:MAG: secretion protein [Deltaproteobacteria bacterium]